MVRTVTLKRDQKPTPEQIAQIEAAQQLPVVFDEDSPALTPETYAAFQRAAAERNARKRGGVS